MKKQEYVILPARVVRLLFVLKWENKDLYFPAGSVFPEGYMEYLEKVLNINRHLPLFSYGYIKNDRIGREEIWQIVKHQMEEYMTEEGVYFRKVMCIETDGKVTGIVVKM